MDIETNQKMDKNRLLLWLASLAFVAIVAVLGTVGWQNHQDSMAANQRIKAESALLNIQSGDIGQGVLALSDIVDAQAADLEPFETVFQYWLPRLVDRQEGLRGLEPNIIYRDQERYFYMTEQASLVPLSIEHVLAYVHNDSATELYILSTSGSNSWQMSIYSTENGEVLAQYPVDGFARFGQSLISIEGSDHVLLSAYPENNAIEVGRASLFAVEQSGLKPIFTEQNGNDKAMYVSEYCDSVLVETSKGAQVHYFNDDYLQQEQAAVETLDFFDMTTSEKLTEERLRRDLSAQIDQQGKILVKEQQGFTLYNGKAERAGTWTLDDLSNWCYSEQDVESLSFPLTQPESALWGMHPYQVDLPEIASFDPENTPVYELTDSSKSAGIDVSEWGDKVYRRVVEALRYDLANDSPWKEHVERLAESQTLAFYQAEKGVLMKGMSEKGDIWLENTFCLLDTDGLIIKRCTTEKTASAWGGNEFLSSSGRYLVSIESGSDGDVVNLLNTRTLDTLSTKENLPMYLTSSASVGLSDEETQLEVFDEEHLDVYRKVANRLELRSRISLDLFYTDYEVDDFSEGFKNRPKSVVFVGEDKLLYRYSDDDIRLKDIESGTILWQSNVGELAYSEEPFYFEVEPTTDVFALYTSEGAQLFQLGTGYPLSEFVYYLDLEDQLAVMSDIVGYVPLEVFFDQEHRLNLRWGNTHFYRLAPSGFEYGQSILKQARKGQ
ncbi:hypothetical protein J4N42_15100 [Vibrio sp. SCSIO 43135]|uniref:hypothetical protein n=1 Tax=Vibrio sp. SCSIO 43135 TaxID=2819096 RepID=UPI0020754D40|nr:hypothetical protein [Vibrio sp. SCSIO 43135]USD43502.1 hypothetical protein J4N42_15100 [Vibrio sp. SCSIO 43135]